MSLCGCKCRPFNFDTDCCIVYKDTTLKQVNNFATPQVEQTVSTIKIPAFSWKKGALFVSEIFLDVLDQVGNSPVPDTFLAKMYIDSVLRFQDTILLGETGPNETVLAVPF